MSIESVMPFNHFMLCRPLLLLPSIFSSIRIFSNVLAVHCNFSLDISCPFSANYCSKQMKSFMNASLVPEPRMRSSTYYKRAGFLGNWRVLRSWGALGRNKKGLRKLLRQDCPATLLIVSSKGKKILAVWVYRNAEKGRKRSETLNHFESDRTRNKSIQVWNNWEMGNDILLMALKT